MKKKHRTLKKPNNDQPLMPLFKRETGLNILHNKGIINDAMLDAALTYGDICQRKPAGGPMMSVMKPSVYRDKTLGQAPEMPDHLEDLWRYMHHTLQSSPIKSLLDRLIHDDAPEALAIIMNNLEARKLTHEALQDLVDCLNTYEESL